MQELSSNELTACIVYLGKVYAKIVDNRIRDMAEEKILEEQRDLERGEVVRTNSLLSDC